MKKQLIKPLLGASAFAAVLFAAPQASAVSYGFNRLTNNGNPNLASQLSVDVTVTGGNVSFQFFNNVGIASDIAQIYFDDGMLSGAAVITDSDGILTGVDYVPAANPQDLPGGNVILFVADQVFNASAVNPAPQNAVDAANEWVTLTFGLGSFADLNGVTAALDSGVLRIGLHVISIGTAGGSDSYVTGPPPNVPDGGTTILLLGSALTGLGLLRRKFGVKIG
jgi:hypothetical protein